MERHTWAIVMFWYQWWLSAGLLIWRSEVQTSAPQPWCIMSDSALLHKTANNLGRAKKIMLMLLCCNVYMEHSSSSSVRFGDKDVCQRSVSGQQQIRTQKNDQGMCKASHTPGICFWGFFSSLGIFSLVTPSPIIYINIIPKSYY